MNVARKYCLLFLLFFIAQAVSAQQFVLLEKIGKPQRIKFGVGQEFRFKLLNNDTVFTDNISAVMDTAVALGNLIVPYSQIEKVWVLGQVYHRNLLIKLFRIGGPMFFGIDTFNRLVNHDSPVISRTGLIVLGAGLGTSYLLDYSRKRWFRIKQGKTQVRMLDLRIEVN